MADLKAKAGAKTRMPMLRWRLLLLLLLTVLGAGLAPAHVVAAEKKVVDFSPGDSVNLFTIPGEMWSNVNEFVFLLCLDDADAKTKLREQARELPGYAEFDAACRTWGTVTFPAVRQLAAELARRDIKDLLLRLRSDLKALQDKHARARAEFDRTAAALGLKLKVVASLSAQIHQQWATLYRASDSIITEYHRHYPPQPVYIRIGPKLGDIRLALEATLGRWTLLAANLEFLRKTLALPIVDGGNSGIPALYDLDIEVGLDAWDEIAQRSESFLADTATYDKFLTGDKYDEACAAEEQRWYVLKLPYTGVVLAVQDAGGALAMQQQVWEGHPDAWGRPTTRWSQQWKISRLGKGWLSVENRARAADGRRLLLDSTPQLSMPGNAVTKNFWWRCLPITNYGSTGWFRLVNATLGEMRSLDIKSDKAVLSPSSGLSGQWFMLEPATPPE